MDKDGPVLSSLSLHDGLNLTPKPEPTLLGLPTEVRVQIMAYLLTSEYCTTEIWALSPKRRQPATFHRVVGRLLEVYDFQDVTTKDSWYPRATHSTPWQRSSRFFPQVLSVCRQLYTDGHEWLYRHNQFVAIKHVPAEWRTDLMRTGEKTGWWLSKEQFWIGFLAAESAGYDAKQPVVSFTISESGPGSRDTYVVLLQDLRMMMSSLQRRLMSEARAQSRGVMRRESKVTMISMEIKNVSLPGLVLPDDAKVTTRFGDLVFPWIGRWLSTVRVRGEQMPFDISDRRGEMMTVLSLQGLGYRRISKMQDIALHRQLEELQIHVETFGPSMQVMKGFVLVYQQAKDARASLHNEYHITAIPFTHLMRAAACRLAYLDVSSIEMT